MLSIKELSSVVVDASCDDDMVDAARGEDGSDSGVNALQESKHIHTTKTIKDDTGERITEHAIVAL